MKSEEQSSLSNSTNIENPIMLSFTTSVQSQYDDSHIICTNRSNDCVATNNQSCSSCNWNRIPSMLSKYKLSISSNNMPLKYVNISHILDKYKNNKKKELFENSNQDNVENIESIPFESNKTDVDTTDFTMSKSIKIVEEKPRKKKCCCNKEMSEEKEVFPIFQKTIKSDKNINISLSHLENILCAAISETRLIHDKQVLLPIMDLQVIELLSTHIKDLENQLQHLCEFRVYPVTYFDFIQKNTSLCTNCSGDIYNSEKKHQKHKCVLKINMTSTMKNETDGSIKIKGKGILGKHEDQVLS